MIYSVCYKQLLRILLNGVGAGGDGEDKPSFFVSVGVQRSCGWNTSRAATGLAVEDGEC